MRRLSTAGSFAAVDVHAGKWTTRRRLTDFFTATKRTRLIETDNRVEPAYSKKFDDNLYVSVSGARHHQRRSRKSQRGCGIRFSRKRGFQKVDDPTLKAQVSSRKARYWDSPNSKIVQLYGFVKRSSPVGWLWRSRAGAAGKFQTANWCTKKFLIRARLDSFSFVPLSVSGG